MVAVRFLDMQGKSLCMAICPYFCLPPLEKGLPRLPPAGGALSFAFMPKRRAAAGEVLARGGLEGTASPKEAAPPRSFSSGIYLPPGRAAAGEGLGGGGPEGPASPKGFTGWGGPGKSEADFSSGEQTVDGNS